MTTNNKVAIVTGASKGIGKSISIGLSKIGYQLVLIGRDKSDLNNVSEEILKSSGISPVIYQLDITNSEHLQDAVLKITKLLGRIDVLINNAGIYFDGSLSLSKEDFSSMLNINLTAQFILMQKVVPVMKKQKSGYIFNIASRAGKIGFAESGGYSASKFGLVGLNESLYRELSEFGISVTAICPGWVNTDMAYKAGCTLQPKEMIQTDDVFKTINWLLTLSPGARIKEVVIESNKSIH